MEAVAIGVPAAIAMGLAFGAGPCNVACLPYLGPVFTAAGAEANSGWRIMLPFSLGRCTGYALLGLVAGGMGQVLVQMLDSAPVHLLLGAATVLLGLLLLRRRSTGAACGGGGHQVGTGLQIHGSALFLMGAGMALNPCLPLTTLLLAAASTGSAVTGLALGAAFGAGAVIIPALIFGLGVAHLAGQLRQHLGSPQRLEQVSALLLVGLGAMTALGWMTP